MRWTVLRRSSALVVSLAIVASGCTAGAPEVESTGSTSTLATGTTPGTTAQATTTSSAPEQVESPEEPTPFIPSALGSGPMPACSADATFSYPDPPPITGPSPEAIEVVGRWGGTSRAVATLGSEVLAGVGATVVSLDLADPSDPREAGVSQALGGPVEGITAESGRAFVAAGQAGLYVLGLEGSGDPAVLAHVPLPGHSTSVAVGGGHAFVAAGTRGLRVVDLEAAEEVAALDDGMFAQGVAVEGSTVYLAAGLDGLVVIDAGDPAEPRVVATVPVAGFAYDVAVLDGTAYVADAWEGVMVVDVENPATPRQVARLDVPGWAFEVGVSGNELLVSAGLAGIRLFDLSEPRSPAATRAISFPASHIVATAPVDGLILAADPRHGVHVIERSPALGEVGLYAPLGVADGVAVSGDLLYVAAGSSGLRILDVADRTAPREIAAFEVPGSAQTVSVVNGYAMVTPFLREHFVIDARDLLNLTGTYYSFRLGTARNTLVHGSTLLTANEWGLRIFDVADPERICQLSFMNICGGGEAECPLDTFTSSGVAVIGPIAYLVGATDGSGIMAIDISDPKEPVEIGALPVRSEDIVALDENNLAVIGGADEGGALLRTIDVSDPRRMRETGAFELPALSAGWGPFLARSGRSLFVSAGSSLEVFDLAEGGTLQHVTSLPMLGGVSAVVADESHVYVANETAGVTILSYRDPATRSEPVEQARRAEYRARPLDGHVEDQGVPPVTTSVPPAGGTCLVTEVADASSGSLRTCLAEAQPGDVVRFDLAVFPPSSPVAIELVSPLPSLSAGDVTVDASDAGVILDGSGTPEGTDGLVIDSDGNVVMGLQILGFPANGISVREGHGNVIGGDRARGEGPSGEGNVVSGNGQNGIDTWQLGQETYQASVPGNVIVGNYIGFDVTGTTVIGNGREGVSLASANDRLGGPQPWERNVIAGSGLSDLAVGGTFVQVIGNYVGLDPTGRRPSTQGHWAVQVGGAYARVEGNVIAGDKGGIFMDGPHNGNQVVGNIIGFDPTGTVQIGEAWGIGLAEGYNRIGGVIPSERNLIASGLFVGGGGVGSLPRDVFILGNWLGVNADGRRIAYGSGEVAFNGTRHFVVGNTVVGRGIRLSGGAADSLVASNHVAVDPTGRTVLGGDTIRVTASDRNAIQFNVIGTTDSESVIVDGDAADNVVRGNVTVR